MSLHDTAWIPQAICVGTDPDAFTADVITPTMARVLKSICNECPVINECRDYAMSNDFVHGVWGGTTPQDRRRLRRAPK